MRMPWTSWSTRSSTGPGVVSSYAYERTTERSWPMAAAASTSCPTTSPMTRPTTSGAICRTSYQSPPTWACSEFGA
ncbi:Uncharacterised protein [Mycobacteroides abscessus]|nr:Uncharacterised protein [Mycobacteroides abscessus]